MKIATLGTLMMAMLAVALTAGAAYAEPTMDSLKASFAKRLPALEAAKHAGKVGETAAGFVAAVKDAGDAASIIDGENADRTALYALIAKKEGASEAQVAERNGVRNFARAAAGDWLQGKDGKWTQKK
jgi:uncharacterized protein YdbL (DUF1318 family)